MVPVSPAIKKFKFTSEEFQNGFAACLHSRPQAEHGRFTTRETMALITQACDCRHSFWLEVCLACRHVMFLGRQSSLSAPLWRFSRTTSTVGPQQHGFQIH